MIQVTKNIKNKPKSINKFITKKDKDSKNIYEQILLIKREKNENKRNELRELLKGGKKGDGIFDLYVDEYDNKELREALLKE